MGHGAVLTRLRIRNFRVLKDVEFRDLAPLTVIFGANGSGKSTIFDALSFLHEMFTVGLSAAVLRRGGVSGMRSAGSEGPVTWQLDYRDPGSDQVLTYELVVDAGGSGPVVARECLARADGSAVFFDFAHGSGSMGEGAGSGDEALAGADVSVVTVFGQLKRFPEIVGLRELFAGWYLSFVNVDAVREDSTPGMSSLLANNGGNVANVLAYLQDHEAERVARIVDELRSQIPGVDRIEAVRNRSDGYELLLWRTGAGEAVPERDISDGTLKLLVYIVLFHGVSLPGVVGFEEPENHLHPKLHYPLAEGFRSASSGSQVFVSTHSPFFVDALRPTEVWLARLGSDGFAQVSRAEDLRTVREMFDSGGLLGNLWMEDYFDEGGPGSWRTEVIRD